MPKKQTKQLPETISPHQKSTRIVDLIRKYGSLQLTNQEFLNVIEVETGKRLSVNELVPLIDMAKRQVQESELAVKVHMDYMVRVGLYESTLEQDIMLGTVQKLIFAMITREAVKPEEMRNENLILNASDKFIKVVAAKSNIITNIGYLSKAREMLEDKDKNEGKTTFAVENEKHEIIDIKELEDNRVA